MTTAAPTSTLVLPSAFTTVNKAITDSVLGHSITVTRIARGMPWPAGYSAQASAFELVAVEMTWVPGTKYTAAIRASDFSIAAGATLPSRSNSVLDGDLQMLGWTVLPAQIANGQTGTGWLVFEVDPKDAPTLRLDYTRPASLVTDTKLSIPKKVFSVVLVGAAG
jgi:hypothetical protein